MLSPPLSLMAVRQAILMVQLPAECFSSGTGDGFVAVSATSGGHTAILTSGSGFDFQYGVSY